MKETEKRELIEKYKALSDGELLEMLAIDKNQYEDGVYELLLTVARGKNLGITEKEIKNLAEEHSNKINQEIAEKHLTSNQRFYFTLLPGIASYYNAFAPTNWKNRRVEASLCESIGLRRFFILGIICYAFIAFGYLFLNLNMSKNDFISASFWAFIGLCFIAYLSVKIKSLKKKLNT